MRYALATFAGSVGWTLDSNIRGIRCSVVYGSAPQSQDGDLTRSQCNMLKRPTPVLRRLSFTQSFRDSVESGEVLCWVGPWTGLVLQFYSIASPDFQNVEVVVVKSCSMAREGVARF